MIGYGIGVVAALFSVALVGGAELAAGSEGGPAADLRWTDLRGGPVSLEDYRGRIVVLNFWATWCRPCRREMPDLARIQREYAVHGVQVVGAAADAPEQRDAVLAFARRLRVNFPVLLGATTEQMEALGLGGVLPATVVLDADGGVARRTNGVIDRRELAATLERLLAGEGVAAEVHGVAEHAHDPAEDEAHARAHAEDAHDHAEGDEHDHAEGEAHAHSEPGGRPGGSTQASLVPS